MISILNQGGENSLPCCGKFSVCAAAGWRKSSLSRQETGEVSKTTRTGRAEAEEQLVGSSECVKMVFCRRYSRTVFIETGSCGGIRAILGSASSPWQRAD